MMARTEKMLKGKEIIICEVCETENVCYVPVDVAWWCTECCNPIYKGHEYLYTKAIKDAKKRHDVWLLENREEMR